MRRWFSRTRRRRVIGFVRDYGQFIRLDRSCPDRRPVRAGPGPVPERPSGWASADGGTIGSIRGLHGRCGVASVPADSQRDLRKMYDQMKNAALSDRQQPGLLRQPGRLGAHAEFRGQHHPVRQRDRQGHRHAVLRPLDRQGRRHADPEAQRPAGTSGAACGGKGYSDCRVRSGHAEPQHSKFGPPRFAR